MFDCDDKLGWVGTPNFQGVVEMSGVQTNLIFNSQGMHDSEHALDKPFDTFRILMLGDSFVHAIQVEEKATSHQVLQNYLNQQDKAGNYEVISAGVTGWGTAQELGYYREQGRNFQPDLVLLMVYLGNDFENNLLGQGLTIDQVNCYAPYFAVCNGQLNPEPLTYAPSLSDLQNNCSSFWRSVTNGMGKLYQNSRLYEQLEPLIISRRPRHLFGLDYPSPSWALYIPADEPDVEQAWQVTLGLIKQLQQEVEADGAKFAVVFFPFSVIIELSTLTPQQQEAILKENPAFATIEIDRPNKRLAEFLKQHDIPFLDLTPLMIEYQASQTTPLHFAGDLHWTVEGNRFVAETLSQWLVQEHLLD